MENVDLGELWNPKLFTENSLGSPKSKVWRESWKEPQTGTLLAFHGHMLLVVTAAIYSCSHNMTVGITFPPKNHHLRNGKEHCESSLTEYLLHSTSLPFFQTKIQTIKAKCTYWKNGFAEVFGAKRWSFGTSLSIVRICQVNGVPPND